MGHSFEVLTEDLSRDICLPLILTQAELNSSDILLGLDSPSSLFSVVAEGLSRFSDL